MRSVLAFGDSNTWGFVPGTKQYERYDREKRWTGILQEKCRNIRIIEEGLCGRTTAFEDPDRPGRKGVSALPEVLKSHDPLFAAILMLGTNDCKSVYANSPEEIGKGVEECLCELEKYIPARNILLISPVCLGEEVEDKDPAFGRQSVIVSKRLKEVYKKVAQKRGTAFLAASDYVSASHVDDEHLDEEGHVTLAFVLWQKLREMNVI